MRLYLTTFATAACIMAVSCAGSDADTFADAAGADARPPIRDAAPGVDAAAPCGPDLPYPLLQGLSPPSQISGGPVEIVGFGLVNHRPDGSYPAEGETLDNGTRVFLRRDTEVLDIEPLTVGARDRFCLERAAFVVPSRTGTGWGPGEEVMLVVQRNGISDVEDFQYDD